VHVVNQRLLYKMLGKLINNNNFKYELENSSIYSQKKHCRNIIQEY
jgi:hypothetical protein